MSEIIVSSLHKLPDSWLTGRAVQWMYSETPGRWWVMTFTGDGKKLQASYKVGYAPDEEKQAFAVDVCHYVNKHGNYGGAWMAGYIDKDLPEEFYLLWKDQDGDIQIPIEFPHSFRTLKDKWSLDDFMFQVDMAVHQWKEHWDNMELTREQREQSLVRGK